MKSNNFFEKLWKWIFSIFLTWILVTGLVYAVSWKDLKEADNVTWTHWQNMVSAISSKLNKTDIPACSAWESLTYDGTSFSCFAPVSEATDIPQAWYAYTTFSDKTTYQDITFDQPYLVTPKVVASIKTAKRTDGGCSNPPDVNFNVNITNVTKTWFRITFQQYNACKWDSKVTAATWIALPQIWWTWSSPTSSSYTGVCWNKRNINKRSWSCIVWTSNHVYYGGESDCVIFDINPITEQETSTDGYEYTTKYTQTCN